MELTEKPTTTWKHNKDFIERMNFADCLGKEYQKMLIPKVDLKGEKLFLRALSMTTIGQI